LELQKLQEFFKLHQQAQRNKAVQQMEAILFGRGDNLPTPAKPLDVAALPPELRVLIEWMLSGDGPPPQPTPGAVQ